MVFNGSDLVNNPFNTTFKPFTDLLGNAFWLFPVSFIAVALYVKTRNPTLVSAFMLASGVMLASGNIFMGTPEMVIVYIIFAGLGLVGILLNVFFLKGYQ